MKTKIDKVPVVRLLNYLPCTVLAACGQAKGAVREAPYTARLFELYAPVLGVLDRFISTIALQVKALCMNNDLVKESYEGDRDFACVIPCQSMSSEEHAYRVSAKTGDDYWISGHIKIRRGSGNIKRPPAEKDLL